MSHSNSSLNCFTDCMAKYNHRYILHSEPCAPPNPHFEFGTMAHDVLYRAGKVRDEYRDGVLPINEYQVIIPSEVLYPELKDYFGIKSWRQYFQPVIKQVAEYERVLMTDESQSHVLSIEREKKLSMSPDQLRELGFIGFTEPLVGIIDLLILGEDWATIIDYKFSTKRKTQDNFDIDSQLQLYAWLVHYNYDIPLHNIKIGYIDIPKVCFDKPTLLSNGNLSRAKTQQVSQEMYEAAVEAVHGDDSYYNCKPGGYYYDCWCNLALNKAAYLQTQYVDMSVMPRVVDDVIETAQLIEKMKRDKLPFIRKYDTYSCSNCEYLKVCKPWLYANGGWQ